jgi:hypothetical protein
LLGSVGGLAVSHNGHFSGSPGAEADLVYVVETEEGRASLTLDEFSKKHGWTNDPERVRLYSR